MLSHPEWASLSCSDCQTYLYDKDNNKMMRGGFHVLKRDPWEPLRCNICPKIPKGDPPNPYYAQELTPENRQAYNHYLEWQAVGGFPREEAEDPIVRRNAAIFKRIHDENDKQPTREMIALLTVMTPLTKK